MRKKLLIILLAATFIPVYLCAQEEQATTITPMIIEKSSLFKELDSLPLLSLMGDSTQIDITRLVHYFRNKAGSMRNECISVIEDQQEVLIWEEYGDRKYKKTPSVMLPVEQLKNNPLFEYAVETDPLVSDDSSGFVTFLLVFGS